MLGAYGDAGELDLQQRCAEGAAGDAPKPGSTKKLKMKNVTSSFETKKLKMKNVIRKTATFSKARCVFSVFCRFVWWVSGGPS